MIGVLKIVGYALLLPIIFFGFGLIMFAVGVMCNVALTDFCGNGAFSEFGAGIYMYGLFFALPVSLVATPLGIYLLRKTHK